MAELAPPQARKLIADSLRSMFDAEGLRRLVRYTSLCDALDTAPSGASLVALCEHVVATLEGAPPAQRIEFVAAVADARPRRPGAALEIRDCLAVLSAPKSPTPSWPAAVSDFVAESPATYEAARALTAWLLSPEGRAAAIALGEVACA